ncbi:hypothetical protein [Nannocystis punicea]|uniref:Uncharacterized protein n=1 Tax=Nannocystis punicea TaxID=2995304 RepID=A0ABY7HF50_9BACT|nr:hypothetical protein [Nannocystis poenicansa]WAS97905.1 hypothetical protein O0S08_17325 [Nannocystis poenicansa]
MRRKTVPLLPVPGLALPELETTALACHEPLLPVAPVPGDPDCEWRPCDADLPVVMDALESLSKSLELHDRSTGATLHWHHDASDLGLWVDVTAVASEGHTRVGLRIRPAGGSFAGAAPPGWFSDATFCAQVALAACLLLALFLVSGDLWVLAFLGLVSSGFTLSFMLGLVVIPERRRALAQQAWTASWRRDFWPALEARLRQRALYR